MTFRIAHDMSSTLYQKNSLLTYLDMVLYTVEYSYKITIDIVHCFAAFAASSLYHVVHGVQLHDVDLQWRIGMAVSQPIKDDECWQSSLSEPGDRLAKLYNLSKLTDLTITFPGHTETLKAHRLILAMSSPVFERMLFGPLAEGEELKLPEDPPEAFKWLMKYIYHGTKELADVKLTVQVYHLASKYQMDALSSLCSQFLQTNLNASNLPLIYDTASVLGNSTLQKKCSEVVSISAGEVFSSPDIGQLSRRSMTHLLQQDLNVISEVAVFQGLVKWGICQTDKESQQGCEGHNLRQEI